MMFPLILLTLVNIIKLIFPDLPVGIYLIEGEFSVNFIIKKIVKLNGKDIKKNIEFCEEEWIWSLS